ncbi:Hypothetical predicted protein, partial [Olea europaea subsp. europaea]
TQPSVPPVAPPSATALPVISVVDQVTSTTPSAPAQAINVEEATDTEFYSRHSQQSSLHSRPDTG